MSGMRPWPVLDLWHITQVRLLRTTRSWGFGLLANDRWPVVVRLVILVFCAALTAIRNRELTAGLLPGVLLLPVAVLGVLPVPEQVPKWPQPLAETLAAALVVGALRDQAAYFNPYLLVPLTTAGLTAGLTAALVCAAEASLVLLVTSALVPTPQAARDNSFLDPMAWFPLLVAAALVSGWSRRVAQQDEPTLDPAYAYAHRLLSELHVVARQLSLGLDPQTLAAALVEEVEGLADGVRATVLIRSSGGRFVPVVGDAPTPLAESVVLDAWVAADLVRRGRSGTTVVALPVLMGERVVAVVVLSDTSQGQHLTEAMVSRCRAAIAQAGPRLASALLFDDVRRLATVDERNRLAREIHDGIAQDMASVGYLLDDIATDAEPEVAARLTSLREHLGGLVGELRLSIFDLRAGVDESIGLARTLGDYVQRIGTQAGLIVHVSTDEAPHRLPVATEVELLRIVQEAVTNVRRHAEANNVWLTVVVDPPRAHVLVADDGRGLGQPRPDSMGITGMKERAARIGANLTVQPGDDGRGTVVEVLLEPSPTPTRREETVTDAGQRRIVADSPSETALPGPRSGGGSS
jgi:signal transduction histidine kinase